MFYWQPRNKPSWITDFNGFLNVCTHQEARIKYWIHPVSTTCGPFYVAATYKQPQLRMHDDVIKWKQFPRYWLLVRGIHRSPVNSPHKGQWRGALVFSLICARKNGWANNKTPVIWDSIAFIMTSLQWQLISENCIICINAWLMQTSIRSELHCQYKWVRLFAWVINSRTIDVFFKQYQS